MVLPESSINLFTRSEYAVSNDNVFEFKNPGMADAVRDVLTDVLRQGARELLAQAIEAEVAEFRIRNLNALFRQSSIYR